MRPLFALLLGLSLAGPALAVPSNPFNDKLKALSKQDREGALRRAITMNDQRCGRLHDSAYRGMWHNLGMWQARCTPGGDFAVFAGSDETVQVRPCGDLRSLKLPECIFKAAAEPAKAGAGKKKR